MKELAPLYAEEVHVLERLEDEEVDRYLEDNLRLIPLFEIDVIGTADAYVKPREAKEEFLEPDPKTVTELHRAQEAYEREMEVS